MRDKVPITFINGMQFFSTIATRDNHGPLNLGAGKTYIGFNANTVHGSGALGPIS